MKPNSCGQENVILGAVVIGRNEGQRLVGCLESLLRCIPNIVYVDSGSTDSSLSEAESRNINCISLDLTVPFTAARARNEGAKYLIDQYPDTQFIQFIDGDCELQPGWIDKAVNHLVNDDNCAIVCGRRRERFPDKTFYNKLCDIEWNTPIGEALSCGGDALIRVSAFTEVDGYNGKLIAGEEPEMCFRLRQLNWNIYRIDEEMTLHDAAMTKISQWWRRVVRTGYAFSLGSSLHGKSEERFWVKEKRRIIVWGILLPFLIVSLLFLHPAFAFLILIYFIQIGRVALNRPELGEIKYVWAASIVFGKIPEAIGLIKQIYDQIFKRSAVIIEYK